MKEREYMYTLGNGQQQQSKKDVAVFSILWSKASTAGVQRAPSISKSSTSTSLAGKMNISVAMAQLPFTET